MPTLLLLPNGRILAHPETVVPGHVVEHDGAFYSVDAVETGTKRNTGELVTMARLVAVTD